MSRDFRITVLSFAVCATALAQGAPAPHHYALHARISHYAGTATVKVDAADPLMDAINAVNEEYGWAVDYEDPPYAGTDLTMRPSPRLGGSPYTVIAGGAFQSTYTEASNMWSSSAAELSVLDKIVSDYNASGNPGNFTVLELPDGNYDVVGVSTRNSSGAQLAVTTILDTRISIPSVPRSPDAALAAIMGALPAKVFAGCRACAFGGTITVGGSGIPARDLLVELAGKNWAWQMVYQPSFGQPTYAFGMGPAMRAEYNSLGQRSLVPVEPGQ